MNEFTDADIRKSIPKFRILIIGKANAGKTTILEKICETKDQPNVTDQYGREIDPSELDMSTAMRGNHDVYNEITYAARPDFVFHDSCGFEAGSVEELEHVKGFIAERSLTPIMGKRLHAIWYCLPTDNDRPLSLAEMTFFEIGTGSVPVVAIFTKYDGLETKAFLELRESMSRPEARKGMAGRAKELLQERFVDRLKEKEYPPTCQVILRDMQKPEASCNDLIMQTLEALDIDVLQRLFLSAQQAKVWTSVMWGLQREIIKYVFQPCPIKLTMKEVKRLIKSLLFWFPTVGSNNMDLDDLDQSYWTWLSKWGYNDLEGRMKWDAERAAFHDRARRELKFASLESLFIPLEGHCDEVIQLGIGIMVMAAYSISTGQDLQTAFQCYQASTTAKAIRAAIVGLELSGQGLAGGVPIEKEEMLEKLLMIVLDNQLI